MSKAVGPEPWRFELAERFDLLPGKGLRWMARVMHYGYVGRGGRSDWQNLPVEGNKAPLTHALRHATEALDLPPGSMARVWKLAKAATNLAMQVWLETSDEAVEEWLREKLPEAEARGARLRSGELLWKAVAAHAADGGSGGMEAGEDVDATAGG